MAMISIPCPAPSSYGGSSLLGVGRNKRDRLQSPQLAFDANDEMCWILFATAETERTYSSISTLRLFWLVPPVTFPDLPAGGADIVEGRVPCLHLCFNLGVLTRLVAPLFP